MQTLKDVKIEMFQNMKDRWNDFLSEEEKYIVEHLESVDKCLEDWDNTESNMKKVRYPKWYEQFQKEYYDKYPNDKVIKYTEDEACDIVCQSLDWIDSSDTESAMWEAWYIRWYEVALIELMNHFKYINLADEAMHEESKIFTSKKLETMFNNLLIN